ncbi:MAG TPA: glycosyltransferase family 2 protein [Armatimonadota bacterium]|nr:glycosyltransferase family 2 protein [Armatimonadota bacterium]
MRLRAEAVRAAGNVLLTPTTLGESIAPGSCGRALLVGSRRETVAGQAAAELRLAGPNLSVEVAGSPSGVPGLWALRRRNYGLVCLLLTGEGLGREKALGLLSGAPTVLAYGANGRWYRVRLPPFRPGRLQWWARVTLSLLLCTASLRTIVVASAVDALRRLLPLSREIRNPGPPVGRRVTFIVPTFNQRHMMDFCLPPLLAEAGGEHTVLVVDDASADDTTEYVRQHYPQVRMIRLSRNQGFGGAVRAGIAASDTPLFALINTDVKVRPGYLGAILPHFDDPDTFAVCSRIELPEGSQMETGNVAPAWSGVLEPYHLPPTRTGPILYAGGASSVFDRAKYEALGGFERIYRPLYFEDIELGYRAWRRGWRSLFEPQASVFHQRRAWIGTRFGDAYANETFLRNGLFFVWKNVRDRGLLAQHVAYVCARLFREILSGDGTMARALLRAVAYCPWLMMKRWQQYRRGDLPDRHIMQLARPPSAVEFLEGGPR